MFEEAKSTLSQLKIAEKPKKSKIEWISERTRSKCTNIWPFWKSCCGFPVWATFKVDIDSEHSVHKVFLIFYGSTTLLFSERTLNGWEQGPFMPKDHVNRGSTLFPRITSCEIFSSMNRLRQDHKSRFPSSLENCIGQFIGIQFTWSLSLPTPSLKV